MALPRKLPLNIISTYRNPIYGLSIIWVMLFHAQAINGFDYGLGSHDAPLTLLRTLIGKSGNVGVDVFLLLSGVCLYFSYVKRPDAYAFLKKRFARIVVPVIIINLVYWIVRDVMFLHEGVWGVLSRITLLRFWLTGDQAIWFVSFIAVMYLAYPLFHRFLFRKGSDGSVVARGIVLMAVAFLFIASVYVCAPDIYKQVEIAITRIPVFVLGCVLGKFVYEKREVNWAWAILVVLCVIVFFVVVHYKLAPGPLSRFVRIIGGFGLTYLMALAFWALDGLCRNHDSLVLRFLSFAGGFSLELYLAHIMVNQVYRLSPLNAGSSIAAYAVVLVIAFVWAWVAGKLTALINGRLLGTSRKSAE